jgi:O-antigen/teichoic acid export membrane protein
VNDSNPDNAAGGERALGVVRHAGTYLIGDVAVKAVGLLSLPLFTRMLSPDEYGVLAVFGSVFSVIQVVLTLNVFTSVARYFYEQRDDFPAFLRATLWLTALVSLFQSSLIGLFYRPLSRILELPGYSLLILVVLTFATTWGGIYRQVLVSRRESREAAFWPVVRGYVGFGLSFAFILPLSRDRYYGPMAARTLVEVVLAVYFVSKMWKMARGPGAPARTYVRYILAYSVPLVPYSLSTQIVGQFDRIVINGAIGAAAAGVYSVGYNVASLMQMVTVPLRTALTPEFFALQSEGNKAEVDRLNAQFLAVTGAFGVLLITFGRELITVLAPSHYSDAIGVIAPVTIGYLVDALSGTYSQYIYHRKQTFYVSVGVVTAGISNILLNLYFVPRYGALAAGYTTLASYAVSCALGWVITNFVLRVEPTSARSLAKPLACLLCAIAIVGALGRVELPWIAVVCAKLLLALPLVLWLVPPKTLRAFARGAA